MRSVPLPRLFGPMLPYDMVRLARRGRFFVVRFGYAALLGGILGMAYFITTENHPGGGISAAEMADFAASFFYTFLFVQAATIALLTPAYTAGAIAEEKEQRTLEYILATDLCRREIVLGKLMSRLAGLGLIVMAGLPVLSVIQLLGGVDPLMLLAGFLASGVTMVSLAGLSILCSVQLRRARDAIVMAYTLVLLYLALSGLSWLLLAPDDWAKWPSTDVWVSPITLADVVLWFNAGNPIANVILLSIEVGTGANLHDVVASHLGPYVLFHGTVAVVCSVWAVLRVRAAAQVQSEGLSKKERPFRVRRRPPVDNRPVLWKETYIEGRGRIGWFRLLVVGLLIVLSFVPAVWMAGYFVLYHVAESIRWTDMAQALGWWARIVGSIVVCLTLLVVGIRAAGSISGERERQTLDALLTSPLENRDILWGKWLGSILGARGGWIWAATIILVGTLAGGVHVLAWPFLVAAWCSYAAFMSGMGLWFSLYCRTSLRACIGTVLAAIGFCCGHWLIWMCAIPIAILDNNPPWANDLAEWLSLFQTFSLMPPVTLGFLALQGWEFESRLADLSMDPQGVHMLICALLGITLYALAALFWWWAARGRFQDQYRCTPQPAVSPKAAALS